jgi:Ser-tRNA(Ala) deacylase AlaX
MVEPSNEKSRALANDKLYLLDTYKFNESGAEVLEVFDDPKDANFLLIHLSKTIFHPQGGGQPSDSGRLIAKESICNVEDVQIDRAKDRVLLKVKKFEGIDGILEKGRLLDLEIDETKRRLHARIHSAGHLLDVAVKENGLDWVPGKGYHFVDGLPAHYKNIFFLPL